MDGPSRRALLAGLGAAALPGLARSQDDPAGMLQALLQDESGQSPYTFEAARRAVGQGRIEDAKRMLRVFVDNYADSLGIEADDPDAVPAFLENGFGMLLGLIVASYGYLATLEARGGDDAAHRRALETCRELKDRIPPERRPSGRPAGTGEAEYMAFGLGSARWVCCALDAPASSWFADRLRSVQRLRRPPVPAHIVRYYADGLAMAGYCDMVMQRYDAAHGFLDDAEAVVHSTLTTFVDAVGEHEGQQSFADARSSLIYPLTVYMMLSAASGRNVERAFRAGQWIQITGTGEGLRNAAARLAVGPELAGLVRRREQTAARLADWEPTRGPDGAAYRASLGRLVEDRDLLASLDAEITRRFPRYRALISPEPVAVRDLQAALSAEPADSAMVVYSAVSDAYYAFVLRPGRPLKLIRLPGSRPEIDAVAADVRRGLSPMGDALPVFPLEDAHQLWSRLFAPLVPDLAGVSRLYVVPQGALEGLPLSLLVSSPPAAGGLNADRYRSAAWLARRFAFVTLPDPGALLAFQTVGAAGRRPFLGFGHPTLPSGSRTPAPQVAISRLRAATTALPETEGELRTMAAALGAGPETVLVQSAATEQAVLDLNARGVLREVRVLAFATHGLTAEDATDGRGPSLVLSSPLPGQGGDGFLSQSEIAGLDLNAEIVILSACDTAASDGSPAGRPLSGLCRSFLYAGARSILATHWKVASTAAVDLAPRVAAAPRGRKPEALQAAMLALIDRGPAQAHPFFWGPFVLIGKG